MRKHLVSVLGICLILALLCACGKNKEETVDFAAPKNYVTVVQVTINPTVNLYLDEDETILAVEYVNADAKECYSKVEKQLVGSKLADGVNKVIEVAEADGYLKENKAVKIDVVEAKQEDKKLEILTTAVESAKTVITEKKIDAEVVLTESVQKEIEDKKAEAEKAAAEKAAAEKAAAEKAAAEKAAAEKAAEKAAAEEAAAEKAAAEKAAAEKAAAEKAAAEKAKKNPITNLKKDVEYWIVKPDSEGIMLTGIFLKFKSNGEYSYAKVPYSQDDYGQGESIVYNGKTYYEAGGGGGGGTYTLTEEKIIMADAYDMVLTMTTDGKLVVEKLNSPDDFLKVGDTLSLK